MHDKNLTRHACYNLSAYRGASLFLYDEFGDAIRHREQYSESEIVEELKEMIEQLEEYRARFNTNSPDDVSLVDATPFASLTPLRKGYCTC